MFAKTPLVQLWRSERARTNVTVLLSLVLASPSLQTGWVADDWLQQLMLRAGDGLPGIPHQPLDLFRFASGDPARVSQLIDQGVFPWWAHPHAVLAFFRPLASLSHCIDHWLWPNAAWLAHVQSLLWYGLLGYVVSACYRRFSGTGQVAALALLLYLIDDAHASTVGWIANRNAVMALALSLPALAFHDAWRQRGRRRSAALALGALGLGLLAGETGIVTCAYLLAYALCFERGPVLVRLRALLPYALLVAVWRVACVELGYGAVHSGLYLDPLREPLAFARAAAGRLPALAFAQLGGPWSDFWELYPLALPGIRPLVLALALVTLAGFARWGWPVLSRSRGARFWLAGALLSLVPMCATFPHDRLLLGPGIGFMGVVAELWLEAWRRWRTRGAERRRGALLALALLSSVHLVIAPLAFVLRSAGLSQLDRLMDRADAALPTSTIGADTTLVLVNPPVDPFAAYWAPRRTFERRSRPAHVLWLATATSPVSIHRTDASSLVVSPEAGFLSSPSEWMLRSPSDPLAAGELVRTDQAEFQVQRSSASGQPLDLRVRFDAPLESSRFVWMQWVGHGYVSFTPPAVGSGVTLPAAPILDVLFGS